MESAVIGLERKATKSFTASFTTLLLAYLNLYLIIHTEQDVEPQWITALLWMEFAVGIIFSLGCLVRTFYLLNKVKRDNNYQDSNTDSYSVAHQLFRTAYFAACANTFNDLTPNNIFNLPYIENQWINDTFNFRQIIFLLMLGIPVIRFIILRSNKERWQRFINSAGTYQVSSRGAWLGFAQLISVLLAGVLFGAFLAYPRHSTHYFLNTTQLWVTAIMIILLLALQAFLLRDRQTRERAAPILQS